MKKKKVVIITNAPAPYRVAFFQYIQEHESGYEFHIVYTSENSQIGRQWHVSGEELGSHSFLECRVVTIHRKYDDKRIVFSVGIGKKLKEQRPDLVICMEYNATILQAVHWCRSHHVPFLSWSDGTANSERNIGKLQKIFRKYVIRRAAGFISSSTATMEHQISYGAEREKCYKSLLTVDIGKYLMQKVDSREEAQNQSGYRTAVDQFQSGNKSVDGNRPETDNGYKPGKKLLYVGSLIGRKGLDLLIPALAMTDRDITLTIVGEGSEEAALKKQAKDCQVEGRIQWLGFLEGEALKDCYRQSDAFILPTREDCYGLVILEAMCASLPVIASKYADGAFDLMEDGVHGYIVDPYDTKQLAEAIDEIFSDTDRLKKMQMDCYERAKEFAIPNVAEPFYKALDAVI